MIYITGDTHSNFDRVKLFCDKMQTTKDDILIILGDAGLNYFANERDELIKRVLDRSPMTFFCVHGNHEQRPFKLPSYKEVEWHGGIVYVEPEHPGILFAKDGEIYELNGKKAIAIGGAYSVDKFYRLARGLAWYDNEQPSMEIKRYVENRLEKADWKVDYVFTHTCPLQYEPTEVFLSWIDQHKVDKTTEDWLGKIEEHLKYERWFCGHFHIDKMIDRLRFMFNDFEIL